MAGVVGRLNCCAFWDFIYLWFCIFFTISSLFLTFASALFACILVFYVIGRLFWGQYLVQSGPRTHSFQCTTFTIESRQLIYHLNNVWNCELWLIMDGNYQHPCANKFNIIINVAYTPRTWKSDSQSRMFTEIQYNKQNRRSTRILLMKRGNCLCKGCQLNTTANVL